MSRADVVRKLLGKLDKADVAPIELPTANLAPQENIPTIRQTGPGQITLGEEVPIIKQQQPEFIYPTAVSDHPYTQRAAETSEGKRAGTKILEKLREATAEGQLSPVQKSIADDVAPVKTNASLFKDKIDKAVSGQVAKEYAEGAGLGAKKTKEFISEARANRGPAANIRDQILRNTLDHQKRVNIAHQDASVVRNAISLGFNDAGAGALTSQSNNLVTQAVSDTLNTVPASSVSRVSDVTMETLQSTLFPTSQQRLKAKEKGKSVTQPTVGRTALFVQVGRNIRQELKPPQARNLSRNELTEYDMKLGMAATWKLAELEVPGGRKLLSQNMNRATAEARANSAQLRQQLEAEGRAPTDEEAVLLRDWNNTMRNNIDQIEFSIPQNAEVKELFRNVPNNRGYSFTPNITGTPWRASDMKNLVAGVDMNRPHWKSFQKNVDKTDAGQALSHLMNSQFNVDLDMLYLLKALDEVGSDVVPPRRLSEEQIQSINETAPHTLEAEMMAAQDARKVFEDTMMAGEVYAGNGYNFSFGGYFDDRGRAYYRALELNPQGDQVSRSLLTLSPSTYSAPWTPAVANDIKEEVIGYIGDLSKLDPSLTGKGKSLSPKMQREVFDKFEEKLLRIGKEPFESRLEWEGNLFDAGEALQPIKALMEYHKGKTVPNYQTRHTIWRDQNASGPAMIAMRLRDENLAKYVDLSTTPASDDAYVTIGRDAVENLRTSNNADASRLLRVVEEEPGLLRKITKKPFMVKIYNAGKATRMENIVNEIKKKDPHGKRWGNPETMAEQFDIAMTDAIKNNDFAATETWRSLAANLVRIGLTENPQRSAEGYKSFTRDRDMVFKSISDFPFEQYYPSRPQKRVKTLYPAYDKDAGGVVAKQQEFKYRGVEEDPTDVYQDAANKTFISFSPNFIHADDATFLHLLTNELREMGIPVMAKHDSFAVPAGRGDDFRMAVANAIKKQFGDENSLRKRLGQVFSKEEIDRAIEESGVQFGTLDIESVLDELLATYDERGIFPFKPGD